jgi:diguanylate cyclase (GGDEF) domain
MIKTYVLEIESHSELSSSLCAFCSQNDITAEQEILIQAFTCLTQKTAVAGIIGAIQTVLPNAKIVGTSTGSWIAGQRYNAQHTILQFCIFQHSQIKTLLIPQCQENLSELASLIAQRLVNDDTRLMLLFSSPAIQQAGLLLDGLCLLNPDIVLAGGYSSQGSTSEPPLQFTEHGITEHGIALASISSSQLYLLNKYAFGWNGIGKQLTLTSVKYNRVFTIDHQPAKDIYAKYLGAEVAASLSTAMADFPLYQIQNGVTLSRNPRIFHADGSITFDGKLLENSKVQFAFSDLPNIAKESRYLLSQLPLAQTEAAFIYSCAGRLDYLKENVQSELEIFKDHPNIAGFFSYGEFFHHNQNAHILGHTLTCLLMSESAPLVMQEPIEKWKPQTNLQQSGLYHLFRTTSNELDQLNNSLQDEINRQTKTIYDQLYFKKLTGLPNRNHLLRDLTYNQDFFPRHLAILDILSFSAINDFYGIDTGDHVLNKVAARIQNQVPVTNPPSYRVYHLTGGQYALAATNHVQETTFINTINNVLDDFKHTDIEVRQDRFSIQFCTGISTRPEKWQENAIPLLTRADKALIQARKDHSSIVFYHKDLPILQEMESNQIMTKKVKRAIRNDQLWVQYQPIYHANNNTISHFECLIRLFDEENKVVPPNEFIHVAQKANLYPEITKKVLTEAVKMIKTTAHSFAVNLSAHDFTNPDTLNYIDNILADRLIAQRLIFEIVETESMGDYELVRAFQKRIALAGASLAVDDFGSGYSNYSHLAHLGSDHLKIDGSLIKECHLDPLILDIVESIVTFSKKIGVKTVAEYVCNVELAQICRRLKIDYLQGYYLSPPVSEPDLLRLLSSQALRL